MYYRSRKCAPALIQPRQNFFLHDQPFCLLLFLPLPDWHTASGKNPRVGATQKRPPPLCAGGGLRSHAVSSFSLSLSLSLCLKGGDLLAAPGPVFSGGISGIFFFRCVIQIKWCYITYFSLLTIIYIDHHLAWAFLLPPPQFFRFSLSSLFSLNKPYDGYQYLADSPRLGYQMER